MDFRSIRGTAFDPCTQTELGKQGTVGFGPRVARGEQFVAVENRIGPHQEAQCLHHLAELAPPCGKPHARGIVMRATA